MSSPSNVTKAVKADAPLVGAPAEFIDQDVIRSVEYPLQHALRYQGTEYRSVTARKLQGKEIFALTRAQRDPNNTTDPQVLIFALMCRVPPAVIEAMDAADITGLSKATAAFTRQLSEMVEGEPTGNDGENTSEK